MTEQFPGNFLEGNCEWIVVPSDLLKHAKTQNCDTENLSASAKKLLSRDKPTALVNWW